jgi:hypothetical protein
MRPQAGGKLAASLHESRGDVADVVAEAALAVLVAACTMHKIAAQWPGRCGVRTSCGSGLEHHTVPLLQAVGSLIIKMQLAIHWPHLWSDVAAIVSLQCRLRTEAGVQVRLDLLALLQLVCPRVSH